MLDNINLGRKLPRQEYKAVLPALQERLYNLQKACWDHKLPTIIVFEGWDASGKGTAIGAVDAAARSARLQALSHPRRAPMSSSGPGCGDSG